MLDHEFDLSQIFKKLEMVKVIEKEKDVTKQMIEEMESLL